MNYIYYGQPVAVLVANDYQKAMYAANLVKIHTLSIGNPILNIDDAYIKKSFLSKPLGIIKGDFKKSIKDSSHSIRNFSISGQDHFYLKVIYL